MPTLLPWASDGGSTLPLSSSMAEPCRQRLQATLATYKVSYTGARVGTRFGFG